MAAGDGKRVVRLVPAGDDADLSIELHDGVNRIGRQRVDNHIVLVSPQVSRFHSEIEVGPSEIVVRDLNSANGTFVNGERVTQQVVKAGDLIGFSDQFTLRLELEAAATVKPDSMMIPRIPSDPAASLPPPPPEGAAGPDAVPESLARRSQELLARSSAELPVGEFERKGNTSRFEALGEPTRKASLSATGELGLIERERQQLASLYQISKKCMAAQSLPELDQLLINVLERTISFERGFIAYQLPNGDWKLVMTPKGVHWDREMVRDLLQQSLAAADVVLVDDSRADPRLGQAETPDKTDQRLLLPLRTRDTPVGMMFVIASTPNALRASTVDFLSLFSEIAALAITNCAMNDRG